MLMRTTFLTCAWLLIAFGGMSAEETIRLPQPRHDGTKSVEAAIAARQSRREFKDTSLTLEQLGQVLWSAQGIVGEGRRTAPSAGALYPLEVYVVAAAVEGIEPGTYHYDPSSHVLRAKSVDPATRARLSEAALDQDAVRRAPASLVIAAEPVRTSRKYGDRAPRYIAIEVGHAGQNVYLQCEALGLGTVAVGAFRDAEVKRVLNLPQSQEALYIMPVGVPR